jgi:RNA methyltransferase, TrmH family
MNTDKGEIISSKSNPKIKQIRALHQRKARQESRLFLVEGIRPVGEAVEAGAELESIVYAPDQLRSEYGRGLVVAQERAGVPCYAVTAEVFESLAEKDNPVGILAVARQPERSLAELNPANFPWGVALVSPADPGNLGTILRTIDAVGASGLLLLENSADPYQPAVVRASMGTLFWYPVVQAAFAEFVTWARRNGYAIYGSSAHAAKDYHEIQAYPRPAILLLGSEREGLSPEQQAACDVSIRLPMKGRATSLNLAVAAGVLLYEMME